MIHDGEMKRLRELPGGVKIGVPITMIWGTGDAYREEEGMELLFELFDNSKAWTQVHRIHHLTRPSFLFTIISII